MGKLIDVRQLLDGHSPALDWMFSQANYSLVIAFAKYAELEGAEMVQLIELARAGRPSIRVPSTCSTHSDTRGESSRKQGPSLP
jgi:hypothetical protein